MKKVRAVVYGIGATGSIVTRMLADRDDVEIVGAICRSEAKVGEDLGELTGLGRKLGVTLGNDADAVLGEAGADVAVVATNDHLSDHEAHLAACARTGTNAITASSEALFPRPTSPEATDRLDELAKANGVTLTGGGMQDIYWVFLVSTLLGSANRVERISGRCTFNLDVIGPDAAREVHFGELPEALAGPDDGGAQSHTLISLRCLASALGLTVQEATGDTRPILAEKETYSEALGETIAAGHIVGLSENGRIESEEGIVLEMDLSGYIFGPGETDLNEWRATGDPDLRLVNPDMPTEVGTAAQLVNRIPDVINAEPGFVTIDRLPAPRYRAHPLGTYLTGGAR